MSDATGSVQDHGSSQIVHESGTDDVADLVKALDLASPRPVIIVSDGAADLDATVKRARASSSAGVSPARRINGGAGVVGGPLKCHVTAKRTSAVDPMVSLCP